MAKGINYNTRNFDEYREQLRLFTQRYYPTIINDFQDASIGSYLMDINASVSDDLGYHSDRMFQETQLDYAQERKSLLSIARTNGLKVSGKRPSMLEAQWSCYLPVDATDGTHTPDWTYAPILNKGTQASGGGQKFELQSDLNFAEQFNSMGVSDRTIVPLRNSNGYLAGYTITKTCVMTNGEGKIYKQTINSSDIEPFMNIVLPDKNVINIESILIVDGYSQTTPTIAQFMGTGSTGTDRWYEVNNLTEDKIYVNDFNASKSFLDQILIDLTGNTQTITGATGYGNTYCGKSSDGSTVYGYVPNVAKWDSVTKKFISEYTDNGYCKIIFGAAANEVDINNTTFYYSTDFTQYQISKILNNKYLGELPQSNSTIYVYYSVGGGKESNIAAGSMTSVSYLNATISGSIDSMNAQVRNSLKVTNTIPSVSGRDELTNDEIRYLIKYNNSAQDRCVTVKDYYNRIMTMPSEFGAPLKVGVSEKNNKVLVTMIGLDYDGSLSSNISETLVNNMVTYLSEYIMINDYVEIQPGKIVNLQFEVDITVSSDKSKQDIVKNIILYIGDYMDVNNHKMGDEIYISKIKSDIAAIDGVKNLIDLRVYNIYGSGYSSNFIKQTVDETTREQNRVQIDLTSSDSVLYADDETMFELKNPKVDIKVRVKTK